MTAQTFVETGAQSWAETGEVTGEISFDPETDVRGPVSLAVAVTVEMADAAPDTAAPAEGEDDSEPAKARLVVIGDSEFANNSFLKCTIN